MAARTSSSCLFMKKWLTSLLLSIVAVESAKLSKSDALQLLTEKLPLEQIPPTLNSGEATEIKCDLMVNNVDTINEAKMDFTVDIVIHMSWPDTNLTKKINMKENGYDYLDIDSSNMERCWTPDLYFPNEKKADVHNIMMPNKMLRLYSEGIVSYIIRVAVTLSCHMDLRKYPFDSQVCSILMESFGYTEDKIRFQWDDSEGKAVDTQNIKELRQFKLVRVSSKNYTRHHQVLGNHSCLQADFHLVRNIGFYVIQMYLPSMLIVMLSWLSFWLNDNSVPGRVTLGVLSVLTISTQSSSINASLPRVSYTKAIDVWMATCLVFAFAALIEFAVVNVLSRRSVGQGFSLTQLFLIPDKDEARETQVDQDGRVSMDKTKNDKKHNLPCSRILDMASRAMFPFAFGCFNMVYWIYYLNIMEY